MTKKQLIFIKEYVNCKNATQSAIKAGYNPRSAGQIAHKLLKKDEIQRKIDAEFKSIVDRYNYTESDVRKGLGDIAENGKTESNRVRAWELIGKIVGCFKEETSIKVGVFSGLDQTVVVEMKEALKMGGVGATAGKARLQHTDGDDAQAAQSTTEHTPTNTQPLPLTHKRAHPRTDEKDTHTAHTIDDKHAKQKRKEG